jgi:transposase
VVKLRKLLAQKYPVVLVDEYRTTKLCIGCGYVLKHPKSRKDSTKTLDGISFCENDQCRLRRLYLSRDKDAAIKIGMRFIAQLRANFFYFLLLLFFFGLKK